MEINLIVFTSVLSSEESVFVDHKPLLDKIRQRFSKVNFYFPSQLSSCDFSLPTMIFVASGGVEESVSKMLEKFTRPQDYIVLIADGLKNSLAASLEILSWMGNHSLKGRVIHGDTDYILKEMEDYCFGVEAREKLRGQRVGIIGRPSGWLIASGVDYQLVQKRWGVEFVELSLDEVVDAYNAMMQSDQHLKQADSLAKTFIEKAASISLKETNEAEVGKAMVLYMALEKIVKKYHLSALTLNCFDLIPTTKTTGCVALALLNDQSVPAGCEGDIQTILTMMAVRASLDQPSFMANPSMILDVRNHIMILAHCTIAPTMCTDYRIRSHFESQSGVAIEGKLPVGQPLTIVKFGGEHMQRSFISGAELLECSDNPIMCRTQLKIRLDKSPEYFLKESIGNHHVVVLGNHVRELEALANLLNQ